MTTQPTQPDQATQQDQATPEATAHPLDERSMISLPVLREAAFQLLASSTIKRYLREARRLGVESGLVAELQGDAELRARVRARLAELLDELERQRMRTPAEFEAAVLLCALVPTDPDGTRRLLQRASESPSVWIGSLAVRQSTTGSKPSGASTASACAADPLAHAA